MKKFIMMLVLAMAFVCTFALSVGAAETNEFGNVEIVNGMGEKSVFGDDGTAEGFTSRVVLFDGKEYHTYPAYYIFTNNVNTTTDFKDLNSLTGKSYGKTSVIRAEVPHNVKKVTGDIFKGYNDLKYVLFPDTLTEISGNMFYTSHGLEWVNVPRDCVFIGGYAFYGCSSLVTIDMSNARSLKRTEANQFYNCPNLKELIFPEGFEYFGGAGGGGPTYQNGLGSLETLYLPDTVTYMGTISEMKSIGTFTVPLGVTTIRANQFSYCSGLNTVVLHKGITSIDARALDMTLYLKDVIYTGAQSDEIVSSIKTAFSGAAVTYGNHCTYYYGDRHLNDTNPCVINCTRCGAVNVPKENPIHSEFVSIVYENGFDKAGARVTACSNEGCKYEIRAEVKAMFNCLGYSVQTYGAGGFSLAYSVNTEATQEYTLKTGNSVAYGVFAVLKDKLGNSDVFGTDGKTADGVVSAEVSAHELCAFEIKVVGFDEAQKNALLAVGAYVSVTKDGTTEYSYMQDDTKGERVGNYIFASYNNIAG